MSNKEEMDNITETIQRSIEEETGSKVFTLGILDKEKEKLEMIVVLENKNILHAHIFASKIGDQLEIRIQGNYI